jgi:hypothetical protein
MQRANYTRPENNTPEIRTKAQKEVEMVPIPTNQIGNHHIHRGLNKILRRFLHG